VFDGVGLVAHACIIARSHARDRSEQAYCTASSGNTADRTIRRGVLLDSTWSLYSVCFGQIGTVAWPRETATAMLRSHSNTLRKKCFVLVFSALVSGLARRSCVASREQGC